VRKTFETFRSSFAHWPVLPLSIVYAEHERLRRAGCCRARLPQRGRGHGLMPLPATAPGAGWASEHVPFERMPYVRRTRPAGFRRGRRTTRRNRSLMESRETEGRSNRARLRRLRLRG